MSTFPKPEVQKWILGIVNNVYELERKASLGSDPANISRNITRIRDFLAEAGLIYEDPMGQAFKETRTDLEASISGPHTENLYVTEVIKPIIRYGDGNFSTVVQRGMVVVEGKKEDDE